MRTWWRERSLRARLTIAASVVITFALCVASVLLVFGLRHSLLGSVDNTAKDRAHEAAEVPAPDGVLTSPESDAVIQIVDVSGTVVASSANVSGEARLLTDVPSGTISVRSVKHLSVHDPADSYRVAILRAGGGRIVYSAVPDDDQREAIRRVAGEVAVGLPVVIGVLALVTWLLVGRALRPVEDLRRQAADISETNLSQRLTPPVAHDDLRRLAETLNDLLGRLDGATRGQREFVADAAHELRSPLAALHAQLEVAAAHPDDAEWREAVPVLLSDVGRISRLTDDLLALARMDGRTGWTPVPVDLDDVVLAETARVRAHARVAVDMSRVTAARVSGEGAALARMVRNLLDNAVQHAATRVDVSLSVVDHSAVLTVADDGPGIPEVEREGVFERFTRLDNSRSRSLGGAGLGLAIVRDVAATHGGLASVGENPAGSGALFVVRMPALDVSEVPPAHQPARPGAPPAR